MDGDKQYFENKERRSSSENDGECCLMRLESSTKIISCRVRQLGRFCRDVNEESKGPVRVSIYAINARVILRLTIHSPQTPLIMRFIVNFISRLQRCKK